MKEKDALNNAIGQIAAPALRNMGFSRSGRYFFRKRNEFVQAIQFEGSWMGGVFYVNSGVSSTELPDHWSDTLQYVEKPKQGNWHFNIDLREDWNPIEGYHRGGVWEISADPLETSIVVEHVLPLLPDLCVELDKISDYTEIIRLWESEREEFWTRYRASWWASLVVAIGYDRLKQTEKARQCLDEFMNDKWFGDRSKGIRDFCSQFQAKMQSSQLPPHL